MDQDDYILPHVPHYAFAYDIQLHTNTEDDRLPLSFVRILR